MTDGATTPRQESWLRRTIKLLVAAIAVGLLAVAVWGQRDGFERGLQRLGWGDLLLAALFAVGAVLASGLSWRASMASVLGGRRIPLLASAKVFLVSQIGKYIPGSVWPVLVQIEMTRRYGISKTQNAAGMLVTMLVGAVSSACVAIASMTLFNRDALHTYWFVLLAVPFGLALLNPSILVRVVRVAGRLLRRDVTIERPAAPRLLAAAGWCTLSWLLFGVHAWIIARDVSGGPVPYGQAVGAFALAWLVGFLVVISPAGVGAREGVLVVAFSGSLTTAEGLVFAVVSRVLLTLVDAGGALVGVLLQQADRRAERTGPRAEA